MVKTEVKYLMIELKMIKYPQPVCHDHDELQRLIRQ